MIPDTGGYHIEGPASKKKDHNVTELDSFFPFLDVPNSEP